MCFFLVGGRKEFEVRVLKRGRVRKVGLLDQGKRQGWTGKRKKVKREEKKASRISAEEERVSIACDRRRTSETPETKEEGQRTQSYSL